MSNWNTVCYRMRGVFDLGSLYLDRVVVAAHAAGMNGTVMLSVGDLRLPMFRCLEGPLHKHSFMRSHSKHMNTLHHISSR